MNKKNSFLFFILCFYNSFSQTITGTIVSEGTKISNAQVILKKSARIVAYTFTDTEGRFIFDAIREDSLDVQVSHMNYETYRLFLEKTTTTKLTIEVVEKTHFLEEVLVKNDMPIKQKKDTAVYDLKQFRDGSERVIEDLLKKLPGVTVNDAGKIFYKNKEIQALMIDGDDLFNTQYTIGSKNLDADVVETVEAIENFNKNKVLHKIIESDRVAINLKLKKGQPVFSSRAILENDFHSKYDNSATTLLLHSKYKGFSVNGINNLGKNYELDFSFIDANVSSKARVREIISEGSFPQFLGERNSLLNNTFMTSNSVKVKMSKQLSSTFDINYSKDRIYQNIEAMTKYRFEDREFVYNNADRQIKRPEVFAFSNYIDFYNDKDLQVNSTFLLEKRHLNFVSDIVNNGNIGENNVNRNNSFIGNKTEITKLLDTDSALKFHAILSQDQSEQRFSSSPSIAINPNLSADKQLNSIRTNFFQGQVQYYHNWEKIKLKLANSSEKKTNELRSHLENNNSIVEGFQNNGQLQSFINQFETDISFRYKKFKFGISQTLWYNQIKIEEKEIEGFSYLFNLQIKYAMSKKHAFQFVSYRQLETPSLINIFDQPILTSYRSISVNEGKIDNIKSTAASLDYTISDFYNTFFFKASLSHTRRDKDYYQTTELSPALIYNKTILLNQGNNRSSFNLSVHKLIPLVKINVKYNISYAFFTTYNFIDNSDLRSVKSKALTNEVILYTSLNERLNLNNKSNIDFNFFEVDDGQKNTLSQIKNEFKADFKITKIFTIKTSLQTFVPDTQKKQQYNFLGFEASYLLTNANCEFYLRGQNLLNHKTFNNMMVSDFAVSSFSYRLQERNVVLGMIFKIF